MTEREPQERLPLPFSNSHWVIPGDLLAGGCPGRRDPDEVMRNILGLMATHEVTFPSDNVTCYEEDPWSKHPCSTRTLWVVGSSSLVAFSLHLHGALNGG